MLLSWERQLARGAWWCHQLFGFARLAEGMAAALEEDNRKAETYRGRDQTA